MPEIGARLPVAATQWPSNHKSSKNARNQTGSKCIECTNYAREQSNHRALEVGLKARPVIARSEGLVITHIFFEIA